MFRASRQGNSMIANRGTVGQTREPENRLTIGNAKVPVLPFPFDGRCDLLFLLRRFPPTIIQPDAGARLVRPRAPRREATKSFPKLQVGRRLPREASGEGATGVGGGAGFRYRCPSIAQALVLDLAVRVRSSIADDPMVGIRTEGKAAKRQNGKITSRRRVIPSPPEFLHIFPASSFFRFLPLSSSLNPRALRGRKSRGRKSAMEGNKSNCYTLTSTLNLAPQTSSLACATNP
ncbi:hypothetical protein B0H17DRAFT_1174801 [Mycena rosella]|uniref:Uncharacterized protein n=1 Tax=Mycena rosella TaxID=1033263 RepID=A0AAD7M9E8_MYCRO|nr:hypothetical protein B0H17DRAFT_1174801 [Mycena rosella]